MARAKLYRFNKPVKTTIKKGAEIDISAPDEYKNFYLVSIKLFFDISESLIGHLPGRRRRFFR